MVKSQLQKQQSEKACFGTKEWSKNSGICNGCDWKDDCGKAKENKNQNSNKKIICIHNKKLVC